MTDILSEYLHLDSHERGIDSWYYQNLFTEDQKNIRSSVLIDGILERIFFDKPSFSVREIYYFGQILKTYSEQYIDGERFYLCTLVKGEYENYDVQLVNQLEAKQISEKLGKTLINYLFEIEYSNYLEHEVEKWVNILSSDLTTMICASVKRTKNSNNIQFRIEKITVN